MKLLIVEDEQLCRESLEAMPWNTIGISLAGACDSGYSAMMLIKQQKPDIILSDIRMDGGDGLYLAKKIHTLMPEIKVIFLTAYNDFNYSREAMKLGVSDYILKPLNTQSVLDSVAKVADELEKSREKESAKDKLAKQLTETKHLLRSYFFSTLNTVETQKLFNIDNPHAKFCTIALSVYNTDADHYKLFVDLNKVIEHCGFRIIPFYETSEFAFLFYRNDTYNIDAVIEVGDMMKDYLNFNDASPYTIGISCIVNGIEQAEYSYKRAFEALKYRFYMGDDQIIYIDDIEPVQGISKFKEIMDTICLNAIKIGDSVTATEIIKSVFAQFRQQQLPINLIQRACLEYFVSISTAISQMGQNADILFNKSDIWAVLKEHSHIEKLESLLLNITDVAIGQIKAKRESKNNDLIKRVKDIINQNYATDISLNEISKQVYISPCYLSTLFNKETNTSFKTYLIQVRMDKAKELLENTDDTIYDISSKVGYKSQKYFSTVFHRITGFMPSEYRLMIKTANS